MRKAGDSSKGSSGRREDLKEGRRRNCRHVGEETEETAAEDESACA